MIPDPFPGLVFTHARRLDPDWRPGPGQTHRDNPPAVYQVTKVTPTTVFYRGIDGRGRFSVDRRNWADTVKPSTGG